MIRIFVTGDNHVGLRYASHEKAELLSSSRISAFEAMVQSANLENCHLFVITGDLFENTYGISKRDVCSVLSILSQFKGIVAILPGNHDYYDKDAKLWQYFHQAVTSYDNIMLLNEYRPYSFDANGERVVLYPALCTSLHSQAGQNNLGWIKEAQIPKDSSYRIGVAHGAVDGQTIDSEGRYFLMKREELESVPLDAWLIGHTHVPFPRNLTTNYTSGEKIFNAGTHVQTDVSCNTEGQCFIIEIHNDKKVLAKKLATGNLHFYRKSISVSAGKFEEELNNELAVIPDNSVVDVIISGAVTPEEYQNRTEITESALSRFIENSYSHHQLSKLISPELIEAEFPETSFSAKLLTALIDNPKEAQLVYELLKSLKGDD